MQPAVFKAVPFDDAWINHDKIDVKAIYRRPILSEDTGEQLVDERGVPRWDLTGGLPVRRHLDWVRKGFEYVTLADAKSLNNALVLKGLLAKGEDPKSFIMLRTRLVGASPWNAQLYLQSQATVDRVQADKLRDLVERLGSDVVLDVRRTLDPTFELPPHLRGIPPGGAAKAPVVHKPAAPVATGPRVKLGPEKGDEFQVCSRDECGTKLGENAYGSPELPGAAFCSQACLDRALPKVAKHSVIGRARKKAAKAGATKVARDAAEVPA